ncbi:uncharacterized protein LOC110983850 [Acanthaster planci]|uniref:Uncharacterized protein LOC110983850 n=1 Tax=Acanthaster planci TaxID=133434 RepID=A0A8B7Z2F0_ACAPL|nr:uncharacterized protein LOC110983850 [Acanthaster planci]
MWGVKTLATFGSATARLFAGCNEFKVGSSVVEVAAKPSTMALRGKLVGLVLVFGGMLSVSANDVEEMGQEIYEETLESGLYPGNEFRTKLYLHPGITWFRITLQNKPGNPLINASVVALSIRVDIDVSAGFKGHIERNWLDATGASQLNPSESSIIGEFPFYLDYVFEVVLYSGLQDFERFI